MKQKLASSYWVEILENLKDSVIDIKLPLYDWITDVTVIAVKDKSILMAISNLVVTENNENKIVPHTHFILLSRIEAIRTAEQFTTKKVAKVKITQTKESQNKHVVAEEQNKDSEKQNEDNLPVCPKCKGRLEIIDQVPDGNKIVGCQSCNNIYTQVGEKLIVVEDHV